MLLGNLVFHGVLLFYAFSFYNTRAPAAVLLPTERARLRVRSFSSKEAAAVVKFSLFHCTNSPKLRRGRLVCCRGIYYALNGGGDDVGGAAAAVDTWRVLVHGVLLLLLPSLPGRLVIENASSRAILALINENYRFLLVKRQRATAVASSRRLFI